MSIPFERLPDGTVKGITYHFTSDGRIDWRRMVEPRFLFVADRFKDRVCAEQGKTLGEVDVTKVRDEWLRIRVAGLNEVAQLRGIMSVEYPIVHVTDSSVTATCIIEFLPTFESGDMPFTMSAIASANLHSVDHDFTPYLATFAENRAFSRCVKRALRINILSDVEIDKTGNGGELSTPAATEAPSPTPTGHEPQHLLEQRCAQKSVTFEAVKTTALTTQNAWVSLPSEWTSFESIQPLDALFILDKMAKRDEEAKGKKVGKKT